MLDIQPVSRFAPSRSHEHMHFNTLLACSRVSSATCVTPGLLGNHSQYLTTQAAPRLNLTHELIGRVLPFRLRISRYANCNVPFTPDEGICSVYLFVIILFIHRLDQVDSQTKVAIASIRPPRYRNATIGISQRMRFGGKTGRKGGTMGMVEEERQAAHHQTAPSQPALSPHPSGNQFCARSG